MLSFTLVAKQYTLWEDKYNVYEEIKYVEFPKLTSSFLEFSFTGLDGNFVL